MAKSKIAITLDESTLDRLDRLVRLSVFPNRSQGIQQALEDHLRKLEEPRLALACMQLDPAEEQLLAEEGLGVEGVEWPEY